MTAGEWITAALLLAGTLFFIAGTAGILRFPDLHSRLHALTKADNLGLGLVVAGLIVQADSAAVALKLAGIWALALVGSAGACYLIARHASDADGTPEAHRDA